HLVASWYQRNIELIASESSALLDLSMQQVPTRGYWRPSFAACVMQNLIFV
ncbi:uncharacterized protein K441DRAFT_582446, partial [Cenococcum geophilum 1.58]|uniref:uncharacterized protein n=1 Tax=Cenococcum geophilum 1.58 TaxID=794803 RepID=UPI00359028C9